MGLNSVYSFIGITLNDTGLQVIEIIIAFSILICLLLEVINTVVMMILGVVENIKWILSFCKKDKTSKIDVMNREDQKEQESRMGLRNHDVTVGKKNKELLERKKRKLKMEKLEASSMMSSHRRDSIDSSPSNKLKEHIISGKISFKLKVKPK